MGGNCFHSFVSRFGVLFLFVLISTVAPVWAAEYDVELSSESISFIPEIPMVEELVRIYASVKNVGEKDVEGVVNFFIDNQPFSSKFFSAKVRGQAEEVWALWTPKHIGQFTIKAVAKSDPNFPEANNENNQAEIRVYVDKDSDRDGFPDSIDDDDDNDGLLDSQEQARGTDLLRPDTDRDGVNDREDAFPLDPSRSKAEIIAVRDTLPTNGNALTAQRNVLSSSTATVIENQKPNFATGKIPIHSAVDRTSIEKNSEKIVREEKTSKVPKVVDDADKESSALFSFLFVTSSSLIESTPLEGGSDLGSVSSSETNATSIPFVSFLVIAAGAILLAGVFFFLAKSYERSV